MSRLCQIGNEKEQEHEGVNAHSFVLSLTSVLVLAHELLNGEKLWRVFKKKQIDEVI
jgi:hypothetical protein